MFLQRVEAEAQQKAAEAAREAAAAAAAMTNGNGVDSSSDNDDVPKIVVDQEFVDEDRDPDEKTEELLKVRHCPIKSRIFEVGHQPNIKS